MEKLSKYSWVLIGIRPKKEGEKLEESQVQSMLEEAFQPGRHFRLFLCGAFVDRGGNLDEMESGLDILKAEMADYHEGDYCIVSDHEGGNLLFLPILEADESTSEKEPQNA